MGSIIFSSTNRNPHVRGISKLPYNTGGVKSAVSSLADTAYRSGKEAFFAGDRLEDNPFANMDDKSVWSAGDCWELGYNDAAQENHDGHEPLIFN